MYGERDKYMPVIWRTRESGDKAGRRGTLRITNVEPGILCSRVRGMLLPKWVRQYELSYLVFATLCIQIACVLFVFIQENNEVKNEQNLLGHVKYVIIPPRCIHLVSQKKRN